MTTIFWVDTLAVLWILVIGNLFKPVIFIAKQNLNYLITSTVLVK
jgi:hypothetical protein